MSARTTLPSTPALRLSATLTLSYFVVWVGKSWYMVSFPTKRTFENTQFEHVNAMFFVLNATMIQGSSLVLLSMINLQIRSVTIAAIGAGVSLSNGTWGRRRTEVWVVSPRITFLFLLGCVEIVPAPIICHIRKDPHAGDIRLRHPRADAKMCAAGLYGMAEKC